MSPFFDELESQLRSAARDVARAQAAPLAGRPPRRRRRWWPAKIDLAPILASVVVVLVVGAALVLLGRGGHRPPAPSGSPPPTGLAALIAKTPQRQLKREFGFVAAATKTVLNSPACRLAQPTKISFIPGAPDRTLLSILGVLRRPATPADRLDAAALIDPSEFVYSGYERRALSAGGESYYVVAVRTDQAAVVPSDRCFALQASALDRYLPKIPAALREQTKTLQAGYIAYARALVAHGPADSICLVSSGPRDRGASCGITAAQIKANVAPENDSGVYIGVVPDGVASVTLSFPATRVRPAHSASATVQGNVYAIRVAGAPQPPAEPAVTWRSADGRVVKTVPVPTPALERAACRANPIPCALIQDGGVTERGTSSGPSRRPARSATAPPSPR